MEKTVKVENVLLEELNCDISYSVYTNLFQCKIVFLRIHS